MKRLKKIVSVSYSLISSARRVWLWLRQDSSDSVVLAHRLHYLLNPRPRLRCTGENDLHVEIHDGLHELATSGVCSTVASCCNTTNGSIENYRYNGTIMQRRWLL